MQIPSETTRPRRSLFGNYQPLEQAEAGEKITRSTPPGAGAHEAMSRAFVYRFLAKAFEGAEGEGWKWLASPVVRDAFNSAVRSLTASQAASLCEAGAALLARFAPEARDDFAADYVRCFGHTVRGDCPMNEIEYGDLKADPLFQPHRLADLGAFYAAFGMEMTPDAGERQDHISIELEFMCVLTSKELFSLHNESASDLGSIVREAQKKFLREHLGRWTPAFTRRLARLAGNGALGALADFTREFLVSECSRLGASPGSEDLLLRPVDEAGEKLCANCGIQSLPPGALPEGAGD